MCFRQLCFFLIAGASIHLSESAPLAAAFPEGFLPPPADVKPPALDYPPIPSDNVVQPVNTAVVPAASRDGESPTNKRPLPQLRPNAAGGQTRQSAGGVGQSQKGGQVGEVRNALGAVVKNDPKLPIKPTLENGLSLNAPVGQAAGPPGKGAKGQKKGDLSRKAQQALNRKNAALAKKAANKNKVVGQSGPAGVALKPPAASQSSLAPPTGSTGQTSDKRVEITNGETRQGGQGAVDPKKPQIPELNKDSDPSKPQPIKPVGTPQSTARDVSILPVPPVQGTKQAEGNNAALVNTATKPTGKGADSELSKKPTVVDGKIVQEAAKKPTETAVPPKAAEVPAGKPLTPADGSPSDANKLPETGVAQVVAPALPVAVPSVDNKAALTPPHKGQEPENKIANNPTGEKPVEAAKPSESAGQGGSPPAEDNQEEAENTGNAAALNSIKNNKAPLKAEALEADKKEMQEALKNNPAAVQAVDDKLKQLKEKEAAAANANKATETSNPVVPLVAAAEQDPSKTPNKLAPPAIADGSNKKPDEEDKNEDHAPGTENAEAGNKSPQ